MLLSSNEFKSRPASVKALSPKLDNSDQWINNYSDVLFKCCTEVSIHKTKVK